MLYNVLVSAVQQRESAISIRVYTHTLYRYIFPPSWPPYPSFSTLGELLRSYSCKSLISDSVGSISPFRD